MALGSKNRDYKTEHRRIKNILALHTKRMKELITEGFSKEEANKIAYDEIRGRK